ncbi:MAG: hypothetical protein ACRDSH_16375 [Pseudonocardiaceae bacterium]
MLSTTSGEKTVWLRLPEDFGKRTHAALLASAEALGSIAHAVPSVLGLGLVTAGAVAAWSLAGLMLPGALLLADRVETTLLARTPL